MKIYSIAGAHYTEDGDLYTSSFVFKTLDEAKAKLKKLYEELVNPCGEDDPDYRDEDAWMGDSGMTCGTNGVQQSIYEIIEREI